MGFLTTPKERIPKRRRRTITENSGLTRYSTCRIHLKCGLSLPLICSSLILSARRRGRSSRRVQLHERSCIEILRQFRPAPLQAREGTDDGSRWRGPDRPPWLSCREKEWVRRLGASPPMRMSASWFGFWTHRIQGRGAMSVTGRTNPIASFSKLITRMVRNPRSPTSATTNF